ncbi:MAG: bifunctional 5,10-methylenetetrahydrofolate dehydrogenase/5,10-methenyltetrahydrofolate cyclohydrolase [Ignavibacteriales bacterium]
MAEILSGKAVVQGVVNDVKARVDALLGKGIQPKLAIMRFGARPDDLFYEKGAKRTCAQVGIRCETTELAEDISQSEAIAALKGLNEDASVHGILVLQPAPKHMDTAKLRYTIDPRKDVDGMSPINEAKVFEGDPTGFPPCTPTAVMEILKYYNISLKGKKVVVVGRSMVVGKPAAMLLLGEHATVTICHSRTQDLPAEARQGDILVAAIGRAKMITRDYVKPGAIVIDVGINVDENGKMCGDVEFEGASQVASMITPVPGGVGSVTAIVLAKHVTRAAEMM